MEKSECATKSYRLPEPAAAEAYGGDVQPWLAVRTGYGFKVGKDLELEVVARNDAESGTGAKVYA